MTKPNDKVKTNFWIITTPMFADCGHRWIAFPATSETLQDVIGIAKLDGGDVWVTEEKETIK